MTEKQWNKEANNKLLGKKIVKVEYLTEKEMEDFGWEERPVSFLLDDGTWVIPFKDDEGNGGGSLFLLNKNLKPTENLLPVIY
jgi:hypothetical protein